MIKVREDIRCPVEVRTEHFSKLLGDLKVKYQEFINHMRRIEAIRNMSFKIKLILSQIIKKNIFKL
jgi:hypothetical protein